MSEQPVSVNVTGPAGAPALRLTRSPVVRSRRNAIVRKSAWTSTELAAQVRDRDAEPIYDRMPCGCAWWSAKGGLSRWELGSVCAPWPPAYPSKAKYRAT